MPKQNDTTPQAPWTTLANGLSSICFVVIFSIDAFFNRNTKITIFIKFIGVIYIIIIAKSTIKIIAKHPYTIFLPHTAKTQSLIGALQTCMSL